MSEDSCRNVTSDRRTNEIRPIDAKVTHRICSGQVIVTLSTAVKELVENSLDAGATSIEIRLVDSGSKLIQVKDNGSGVEERNFAGLARKHHTSKLSEFEDLDSIGTFGFRGEALSSLCALAEMSVTTRSKESRQGFQIEYNQQGEIVKTAAVARELGTTVTLRNIFSPLPVRHKEFLKHLKREFNRMVTVLYGYSVVATGVRISCTNDVKGASTSVLCVPAVESIKERIGSVFGSKQVTSLVEIESEVEIEDAILEEFGLTRAIFDEMNFHLSGWMSGPNSGRSATDRQFYFVNSRPWDSPKISRLVNEIYHTFSRSQFPLIFINIKTNQENVDVNVTPDKRSIFLQNEKTLYAQIKGTLLKTLTKASSTFSPSQSVATLQTKLNFSSSSTPLLRLDNREETEIVMLDEENDDVSETNEIPHQKTPASTSVFNKFQPQLSPLVSKDSPKTVRSYLTKFKFGNANNSTAERSISNTLKRTFSQNGNEKISGCFASKAKQPKLMDFMFKKTNQATESQSGSKWSEDEDVIEVPEQFPAQDLRPKRNSPVDAKLDEAVDEGCSLSQDADHTGDMPGENSEEVVEEYSEDYFDVANRLEAEPLLCMTFSLNWKSVLSNISAVKKCMDSFNRNTEDRVGRKFRAKISPDQNGTAEHELKQSLSKEMFKTMGVIGQFNLGFIIAKMGSDLFIVDQHAADEKFNYEDLEKRTVLKGQRLIIPMQLQLPLVSENILIENLEVFEKNGFSFNIYPNREPTKRISLTKIPYSKSCQFGKQDVEELIYLLEDAPEKSFYRPIKVKTMLASRACRQSVMIGDKLSNKDMRRVVGQLGVIEHPWNCPHGRPTLRHLFNMDLLPDVDWFLFGNH